MDKGDQGENHPQGHSSQLQVTHIPTWYYFREEEVVHVRQGVECQGEEEQGAPLLLVRCVIVPQHQAGHGGQDDDAQQEMQGCHVQKDRQQHQSRNHGDLNLSVI